MQTLLTIVGGAVVIGGMIMVVCVVFVWTIHMRNNKLNALIEIGRQQERRRLGSHIVDTSYWFGEDKKTAVALKLLGESLSINDRINPSEIRSAWRRAFKEIDG